MVFAIPFGGLRPWTELRVHPPAGRPAPGL